jgi:hypothetical protein
MSTMDRRKFIGGLAIGTTAWAATGEQTFPRRVLTSNDKRSAYPHRLQSELLVPAFRPMPLGSIRPRGWLARQLRLQADGLSGHLDEFWPDVADSKWFGGAAEGWERAPYWLDGVIPLAWLLQDEQLKEKVTGYIGTIVERQRPDGWYGPYEIDSEGRAYDLWAILLANKMMVQYHEATGDASVLRAIEKSLRTLASGLEHTPLHNWGRFRWFEGLIPTFYLYERTGEIWLLDLARKLREQGFDYSAYYRGEDVTLPTPRRGLWTWEKHVVNTGMMIKAEALAWRLEGRSSLRDEAARMLTILDRYHGQVNGMFTGDECLAGKNPVQGTELCAVVEFMYSLEIAMSVLGHPEFGDRLERVAFNALPATFTPDMWAHQYDQQVNQVQCTHNPDHMWTTNGPESNLYGLEPNYGCCTSNMHQGWPKFAAHLFMRAPEDGLAVVAYAPAETSFEVGGVSVSVGVDTDYPFRDTLTVTVNPDRSVRFPLHLRVPDWAEGATLQVGAETRVPLTKGTFHRLEREWAPRTEVYLRFPMRPRVTVRYNDAISVERGPLVYSLSPTEGWTQINKDNPLRQLPHADFEVRSRSSWNYGLLLDPDRPEAGLEFHERQVGDVPFSPAGAGMVAAVRGRRLPRWQMRHGWTAETPPGVQPSEEPLEELELLPYGCTNIRVTEFPRLGE